MKARKKLAEWSKTPEGQAKYEEVANQMRKEMIPDKIYVPVKYAGTDVLPVGVTMEKVPQGYICYVRESSLMRDAITTEVLDFSLSGNHPHLNIPLSHLKYHSGEKVKVLIYKDI